jgi:transposase
MAKPYSMDLRARVLAAYDRGMETKEVSETFKVCPSWARRVKQRRRESGELGPRAMGGKRREKIDRKLLAELVSQQPDATLEELRKKLRITCALSAISAALKGLSLSFKKRRSMRPSRTGRMWRSNVKSGSAVRPRSSRAG